MDSGYIKLWRKLMKSDMYAALNSVQRDVMIQCLMLANHAPKKWEWNGQIFECQPGQFITSLDSLRKACASDVTTQKIKTSLSKLEKWDFLTNESTKTGRLITVKNWHTYQNNYGRDNKEANQESTKHQLTANQQLTPTKNDKELKELKELKHTQPCAPESSFPEKKEKPKISTGSQTQESVFAELKTSYPKKVGKFPEEQEVFRRFCLVPEDDWPLLLTAVKNYADSEQVKRGVGIKDPKNFIGNQMNESSYWKEWIEPEKTEEMSETETLDEYRRIFSDAGGTG